MARKRSKRKRRGKPKLIRVKMVKHPGTKAQPFLNPALQQTGLKMLNRGILQVLRTTSIRNKRAIITKLDRAVRIAAAATQAAAKRLVPVDTSRLKGSINFRRVGSMQYVVGTNVSYAKWVEEGTKPHVIRARRKPFLVFKPGKSSGGRGRSRGSGRGSRR